MITKTITIVGGVEMHGPVRRQSSTASIELDNRVDRADLLWRAIAAHDGEVYLHAQHECEVAGEVADYTQLYVSTDGTWAPGKVLVNVRNMVTRAYCDHAFKTTVIRVSAENRRHLADVMGATFVTLTIDNNTLLVEAKYL